MLRPDSIRAQICNSQATNINMPKNDNTLNSKINFSSEAPSHPKKYIEIETPKREALLMSPSALVQVEASPLSKRYLSMRKIYFSFEDTTKMPFTAKKLNFTK